MKLARGTAIHFPGGERGRLTALYATLLLLAGGGLIALVYLLLRQGLYASISGVVARDIKNLPDPQPSRAPIIDRPGSAEAMHLTSSIEQAALHRLLLVSLAALTVFALISVGLAWWMAGRVLEPVSVITRTARSLSRTTLHERIALDAPPGELKDLADTFDAMLDRIEQLLSAQSRFAANAAHELRTSVAKQRAAAEIGLAGRPGPEQVAYIRGRLIESSEHSQAMIDGLLLLARSERGLERQQPVALDEVAATVVHRLADELTRNGLTIDLETQPCTIDGDPLLLERLVHNLVSNAIRYNMPGGWVHVRTGPDGLAVANSGPVVPAGSVQGLFEPFRRLNERHQAPGEGAGLGLSIVAAIAQAHERLIDAEPNAGGGLTVSLR
ncbi:ATP-binding protein [Streptomyces sp. PSRA5]|uniref:sensor histidine kinase n=1 Tax=Streptomyces panacea TaxID=3035064 RepID=UPI00339CEC77